MHTFIGVYKLLKQGAKTHHKLQSLPDDDGWSDYGEWSACSAACGEGTRTRSRMCMNPDPTSEGTGCVGETHQTEPCYKDPCEGTAFEFLLLTVLFSSTILQ